MRRGEGEIIVIKMLAKLEKYIMIVYNNRIVYDISSITWEHDDRK